MENENEYELADLRTRFIAFLTDGIFIYAFTTIFVISFPFAKDKLLWIRFLAFLIFLFYFIWFWLNSDGQTFGGKLTGTKVLNVDGNKISRSNALSRSLALTIIAAPATIVISILTISILIFSILTLARNSKKKHKQTFWDMVTKTIVIKGGTKWL